MLLSVIIPIFNEEKSLHKNLQDYLYYLKRQDYDFELVLVNDGSSDNSGRIAREFCNGENIILIDNKVNRGKGAAVCEGLVRARGAYRLFMDADGATSIEHIDKIWKHFREGAMLVIGSRNIKDSKEAKQIKKQALWKRTFGVCGNKLIQLLAIKGIHDTQCGFKAFRKEAVLAIIPKITINGWGFDVEILAIAQKYGYKISIIGVEWKNSEESRVGFWGYFRTIKDLLQIKIKFLRNSYSDNTSSTKPLQALPLDKNKK